MYIFGGSAVKCCVPISSRLPVIISVLLLTLGFICSNFSMSSSRASLSFGFFASCIQGFKNCLIIFVSSALIQLGKKLDSNIINEASQAGKEYVSYLHIVVGWNVPWDYRFYALKAGMP